MLGRGFFAGVGVMVFLVLTGGYLVDSTAINFGNVETMKGNSVEAGSYLTHWGECRLAHVDGRNLLLQNRYDQALLFLEEAAGCSDDPWAWFDLGTAQYAAGDLNGAAESWRHSPEGYLQAVRLAQESAVSGDDEATLAAWQFASQIDPMKHTPYIQMARLVVVSDPGQAETLLLAAIEVNPEDPAAFIELGGYYRDMGNRAEAQPYFESAYALDPTNVLLLVNLAENATLLGDTPAAIDYWQEVALRNERRRAMAYFHIGELTYQDNNFSSALAFFQRAVEISPENGPYLLGLANTYYQLGCYDEATDAYQQILSFASSKDVLAEAQLKLAELAVNTLESVTCPKGP